MEASGVCHCCKVSVLCCGEMWQSRDFKVVAEICMLKNENGNAKERVCLPGKIFL